jgi:pimeloyl-ACP methyl ester carboxylesterase
MDANGVRLHYLDWNNSQAQTMLILHGLQDSARSWDTFASSMSELYHVIALDSRGHGDSEWLDSSKYTFHDYVSDVGELVGGLALTNIVLVGHSAGGRYTFVYAAEHPEVVDSLIVVDIDPDPVNPDTASMFERYNAEPDEWKSLDAVAERLRIRQPQSSEEMLQLQAEAMTRNSGSGKRTWKRDRAILGAYQRPDLWQEWSKITTSTLIVRGRQSNLLTHETAVKMREAIPNSRLAELEGGGHWFYQEFPGAFEATVRWFLESQS